MFFILSYFLYIASAQNLPTDNANYVCIAQEYEGIDLRLALAIFTTPIQQVLVTEPDTTSPIGIYNEGNLLTNLSMQANDCDFCVTFRGTMMDAVEVEGRLAAQMQLSFLTPENPTSFVFDCRKLR
jgi:hypothetical protein